MGNEMTALYILTGLIAVLSLINVALIVMLVKKSGKGASDINADRRAADLERDIAAVVRAENAMLAGTINAYNEKMNDLNRSLNRFTDAVGESFERLRDGTGANLIEIKNDNAAQLERTRRTLEERLEDVRKSVADVKTDNAAQLERIRKDNAEQLEKMRETVDEKLSSTLEKRFDNSFKLVGERLEAINKSFAELQNLQSGVNDLNRIFKNVKTRGTWGEIALESLLSQVLNEEQYEKQCNVTGRGSELVDFAIKLPGKGDGVVMLPVDAKFPVEDYQRLIEASDNADAEGVERAGKALEQSVKKFAQSIRDKYIAPPKTTDFAIMYLPVEGLYAEVVKRIGLLENLQNQYRVVVCGPTTLAALLNSLQMGFKSVAIEKRSTEISKLLTAFAGDFDKFCTLLQRTGKKLEGVQSSIAQADKRTELIRKKLNKVQKYAGEMTAEEKRALLASDEDDFVEFNDSDGGDDGDADGRMGFFDED